MPLSSLNFTDNLVLLKYIAFARASISSALINDAGHNDGDCNQARKERRFAALS